MSTRSRIEWTETTWNPTTGCDRISAGCDHCYALSLAGRLKAMGSAKYQHDGDPRTSGPGFGVGVHPDALSAPLRRRRPRLVFVNSMSDLFHARVPTEFIARVFEVMAATPHHTYQVLTKRSTRLRRLAEQLTWPDNVWMGVSVENAAALYRVDDLLQVPAAVRFLSCEPLLGPVQLRPWIGCLHDTISSTTCDHCGATNEEVDRDDATRPHNPALHWVIAGGESGPAARPMHPSWAGRSSRLAVHAARQSSCSTRVLRHEVRRYQRSEAQCAGGPAAVTTSFSRTVPLAPA